MEKNPDCAGSATGSLKKHVGMNMQSQRQSSRPARSKNSGPARLLVLPLLLLLSTGLFLCLTKVQSQRQNAGTTGARNAALSPQYPNLPPQPPQQHSSTALGTFTPNDNEPILPTSPVLNTQQAPASSLLEQHQAKIRAGLYGKAPIADLIRALDEVSGGPDIQSLFQALTLRKEEALPLVKAGLLSGSMIQKHMISKLLRYSPWPETKPELIALARSGADHWLPRQGALYALGALGEVSAAPEVAGILGEPDATVGVHLVAIATLARLGYREAAPVIRPFERHEDIHLRLFATRALAEFGEPVAMNFLLQASLDQDYVVRQEAAEALWAVEGNDAVARLQFLASNDSHEAVRDAATQALLRRQIRGQDTRQKLDHLKRAMEGAGRHTATWMVRTMIEECGQEGRAFAETLASRDDRVGECSRAHLALMAGRSK